MAPVFARVYAPHDPKIIADVTHSERECSLSMNQVSIGVIIATGSSGSRPCENAPALCAPRWS